jgi:Fe-S-cluster containining protein
MSVTAASERKHKADALCMECGLCCDGTFFGSVVVAEDERDRLRRVGLRVVDGDGGPVMPQRCSALRGSVCSVYADRPKACRAYECSLRESFLAGSTSEEVARASLARMRVLLLTIRRAFDLPEGTSIWEAIVRISEPANFDPTSPAGQKLDEGIRAVSELLELARAVFEPAFAGGGRR